MSYPFPSEAWLHALMDVINRDKRYAEVAKNWEGDILFVIDPDNDSVETAPTLFYMDLWHGACRHATVIDEKVDGLPKATFVLRASRAQFMKILQGQLDALQAMLTRRLRVEGNLGYMLRNVPTVLDFVRCCQQVGIQE